MTLLDHLPQLDAEFDLLLKQGRHVSKILRINEPALEVMACHEDCAVVCVAPEYATDCLHNPGCNMCCPKPFNSERLIDETIDETVSLRRTRKNQNATGVARQIYSVIPRSQSKLVRVLRLGEGFDGSVSLHSVELCRGWAPLCRHA